MIAFERVTGANSDIWAMDSDGGSLRQLTTWVGSDFAPNWSSRGEIVFVSDRSGRFELFRMAAGGTSQRLLTAPGSAPTNTNSPDWAPGGRRLVFTAGAARRADLYTLNVPTVGRSRPQRLFRSPVDEAGPAWSPSSNEIVFSRDDGSGRHLYRYLLLSRRVVRLTRGPGSDLDPAWSPDGRRIAFTHRAADGNYDVYVFDLSTRIERRLTQGAAQDRDPTWSPDSGAIAFVTNRDAADDYEIYVMGQDGSSPMNITRSPETLDLSPDWSSADVRPPPRAAALRTPQLLTATCDQGYRGTDDANVMVGKSSDQVICGKQGNDTIWGGGGNDDIRGGAGKDVVYGGPGRDVIQGGDGKDKLYGGPGADIFYPGSGKDYIDGGPGGGNRCPYCDDGDTVDRDVLVG